MLPEPVSALTKRALAPVTLMSPEPVSRSIRSPVKELSRQSPLPVSHLKMPRPEVAVTSPEPVSADNLTLEVAERDVPGTGVELEGAIDARSLDGAHRVLECPGDAARNLHDDIRIEFETAAAAHRHPDSVVGRVVAAHAREHLVEETAAAASVVASVAVRGVIGDRVDHPQGGKSGLSRPGLPRASAGRRSSDPPRAPWPSPRPSRPSPAAPSCARRGFQPGKDGSGRREFGLQGACDLGRSDGSGEDQGGKDREGEARMGVSPR